MDKVKKILRSPLGNRKSFFDNANKTFGVPLTELMSRVPDGSTVPLLVEKVCNYIKDHGLNSEGIFRVNGNAKYVERLKDSFERTGDADFLDVDDVYAIAGTLKLFLRELPEGVIPAKATKEFVRVQDTYMRDSNTCIKKLLVLIKALPPENYNLLKYLSRFLVLVSMSEVSNKMSPIALGIVFGPNLFRCSEGLDGLREQGITNQITCKFIVEYDTFFKGDNETSPYSVKSEDEVDALLDSALLTVLGQGNRKPRNPPARPPPPKIESEYVPVPSPRRHRIKSDRDIHRDVDNVSDDSCDSHSNLIRSKPSYSPRVSDDDVSRSSSPFLLGVDSDGGESTFASPRVSACTSELVDRVIRATVSERLFGDGASSSDETRSDPGSGPVPAPRRRKKGGKTNGDSPRNDLDSLSDVSIQVPMHQQDNCRIDLESLDDPASDTSSPFSTPVPKPRSPKKKQKVKSPTVEPENDMIITSAKTCDEEDDLDCVQRSELLTGFKRNPGPNRRSPSKGSRASPRPKSGWINGDVEKLSEADRYKTYPPRGQKNKELSLHKIKTKEEYFDAEGSDVEEENLPATNLQFLDLRQNGTQEKSPELSPGGSRKPYVPPLDLSILHEHGDGTEPIRAGEGPSLAFQKDRGLMDEDQVLLSPRALRMKKKNGWMAEASPSSFKSCEYMSTAKQEEEYTATVKHLTKKIQTLKKKVKQFDDDFEMKKGYKPSQTDRARDPETKSVILELTKARKELKWTKDEYRGSTEYLAEHCSGSRRSSEDELDKPDMAHTLEVIQRRLRDKRHESGRPHDLDEMNNNQIQEEKLAIQKALLYFESLHGRPSTREEKELMRPLYDRYRNIKRLISTPKSAQEKPRELQPLPEDQAIEFSSSTKPADKAPIKIPTAEVIDEDDFTTDFLVTRDFNSGTIFENDKTKEKDLPRVGGSKNAQSDAALHEMNIPQLIEEQSKAKGDKRRLRRVLKEFEDEFCEKTGRKVQKEDRGPREAEYLAYKQVKAKLRLLDALISKRDPTSSL